ncbi:MAG: DUF2383 domain-containing protein [Elusimicrobiota bacterium]|nr:DUF2383 domain-containing protein [Elusimicrobiota bacterium]
MDYNKEEVQNLSTLVRGELAAVETYKQALDKISTKESAGELKRIESDHEQALKVLREHMAQRSAAAPVDSGLWGEWAKAVAGAASAFGDKAAIKALKEGEEHGVYSYERALGDESMDAEIRRIISSQLLPKTKAHITVLDRLLVQAGK